MLPEFGKLGPNTTNIESISAHIWTQSTKMGQVWPQSAKQWSTTALSDFGQTQLKFDRCPSLAEIGLCTSFGRSWPDFLPKSTDIGRNRPAFGRVQVKLVQVSTKPGQIWSSSAQIGQISLGQNWVQTGKHLVKANAWPNSAKHGRFGAECGQDAFTGDQHCSGPNSVATWANFWGQHCWAPGACRRGGRTKDAQSQERKSSRISLRRGRPKLGVARKLVLFARKPILRVTSRSVAILVPIQALGADFGAMSRTTLLGRSRAPPADQTSVINARGMGSGFSTNSGRALPNSTDSLSISAQSRPNSAKFQPDVAQFR